MPIDVSMYAQPQQPNALQQMGTIQGIANAAEQNKLLQQQQQLMVPQISTEKAQLLDQQFTLVGQKLAQVYGADNGSPTRKHLIDGVSELIAHNPGIFDKNFAAQALSDIPSEDETGKNPNAVKQWLIGKASMTERGRQAIQPLLPDMRPVDVGGQIQMVDMNPRTNPKLAGMQLQKGFTPGEATAPDIIGYDPQNGAPITGTHAQATAIRQGGAAAPGALPATGGAAPAAAPGTPGAASAPTPGNGLGIKAPPPGMAEANAKMAGASADQAGALQTAADHTQDRMGMLETLQDAATKFESGPAASAESKLKALWNEHAPGALQIGKESVAAQEEFAKYAQQLAQQQLSAMGGTGTQEHLLSAIAANPHDALSSLGLKKITQTLQAAEDAIRAKYAAWQDYSAKNGGAASYGKFIGEFNKNYDLRAFQFRRMDPSDRQDMIRGMKPEDRAQFRQSLEYADNWASKNPNKGQ